MFPGDLNTEVKSITKEIEGKKDLTVLTFPSKTARKHVVRTIRNQNKWLMQFERASDGAIQVVMKTNEFKDLILGKKQNKRILNIHQDYYADD